MKAYIIYFPTNGQYRLSNRPVSDDWLAVSVVVEMDDEEYHSLKATFEKANQARRRIETLWWEERAKNACGD